MDRLSGPLPFQPVHPNSPAVRAGASLHRASAVIAVILSTTWGTVASAQTVRCTSDAMGTTTYTRCSDGTRSTADRVGGTAYIRDNTGRRATVDEVGGTSYLRDNRGTRGTMNSYSGTSYYRDNQGVRGTLDTYGSTTYYRDNQGSRGTIESYVGTTTTRLTMPQRPAAAYEPLFPSRTPARPIRP